MEKFFFLQKLSFSPLRSHLQEAVLNLCDQNLTWVEFQEKLWIQFPESKTHLDRYLTEIRPLLDLERPEPLFQRLIYGDPFYPKAFRNLVDPPWTLTIFGDLKTFLKPCLTIIGSREPTEDSIHWIESELSTWPEQGWVFASGGARGIDQRIHQVCLRQQKPTLIFLPSGMKQLYPQSLTGWMDSIKKSKSCFVSEFPDGYPMRKYSFSFRNRLLASLGAGLLVIQAAEKSGTLMTAHLALEMGRPVFVLPAHPRQRNYHGNLELMLLGAQWVKDANDLSLYLESEKLISSFPNQPIEAHLI